MNQAKPAGKPCRVCALPASEREMLDDALTTKGQSPRSAPRRYAGLTRHALSRHRDVCLKAESGGVA